MKKVKHLISWWRGVFLVRAGFSRIEGNTHTPGNLHMTEMRKYHSLQMFSIIYLN